jgi:hypothetical protein
MQRQKRELIDALHSAMLTLAGDADRVTEENLLKVSSLGETALYLEQSEFNAMEEFSANIAVGDSITEWVHRHNKSHGEMARRF